MDQDSTIDDSVLFNKIIDFKTPFFDNDRADNENWADFMNHYSCKGTVILADRLATLKAEEFHSQFKDVKLVDTDPERLSDQIFFTILAGYRVYVAEHDSPGLSGTDLKWDELWDVFVMIPHFIKATTELPLETRSVIFRFGAGTFMVLADKNLDFPPNHASDLKEFFHAVCYWGYYLGIAEATLLQKTLHSGE